MYTHIHMYVCMYIYIYIYIMLRLDGETRYACLGPPPRLTHTWYERNRTSDDHNRARFAVHRPFMQRNPPRHAVRSHPSVQTRHGTLAQRVACA